MVAKGQRSSSYRVSTPSGKRKNERSTSSRAASAVSSSRGARGPSSVRRLMTRRSRTGSIGGFVTWAKRWRRKWWTGRVRDASDGSGESSPMENVGS
jgi:hypothetical protein